MEELVSIIVKVLVDYLEDVVVWMVEKDWFVVYELIVYFDDVGKVIGK